MNNKLLERIMKNVYDNSKVSKKNLTIMKDLSSYIKNKIKLYLDDNGYKNKYNFINQGSYALYTMAYIPSDNDIDMDMGIIFQDSQENSIIELKKNIFNYMKNILKDYEVKEGKCALQIKNKKLNIHFDIVIYIKKRGKEYLLWFNKEKKENIFILDNKTEEMNNLKEYIRLSGTKIKQIIIFLKFIYKSISKSKVYSKIINEQNKLASIVICEIVAQYYYKLYGLLNTDDNISIILIKILTNLCKDLRQDFSILTSNTNNENLLDNYKRNMNKNSTIFIINKILNEINNFTSNKIKKKMQILNKIKNHEQNKYLLLDK